MFNLLLVSDAENTADAKKDGAVAMDRSVAEILCAKCKVLVQDELYDNPELDEPCLCKTCVAHPPMVRLVQCRCSGCSPEVSTEVYTPPPKQKKAASDIPQSQRLTKAMKEVGTLRLEEFRLQIWFDASDVYMGMTPLAEFLPDIIIKSILDNFARYKTVADLSAVVGKTAGMVGHHIDLLGVLEELKVTFARMKKDKASAAKPPTATTQKI
ncbi:hypothetical protein B0H10DRAFT_2213188 [Mycena sp. CBHHK59/15]|nr:hypothetical protein B0H10DRAFT_2213188 [Mycena sp. CBHHK59/15]